MIKYTEIINAPWRRHVGRPRNPKLHLLALEYLLWPAPRPHGLLKEMAGLNDVDVKSLLYVVRGIVTGAAAFRTQAEERQHRQCPQALAAAVREYAVRGGQWGVLSALARKHGVSRHALRRAIGPGSPINHEVAA